MAIVGDTKKRILLTGGIRSGKSAYALELASLMGKQKVFLATAEALDDEMNLRIKNHQLERGDEYQTIEEPLYIADRLKEVGIQDVVIIDCLTLWVNNLMFKLGNDEVKMQEQKDKFFDFLKQPTCSIIMVTNEVGLGVIPENKLSRQYINMLGRLNQDVARISDEMIMMISGIAQQIKKEL